MLFVPQKTKLSRSWSSYWRASRRTPVEPPLCDYYIYHLEQSEAFTHSLFRRLATRLCSVVGKVIHGNKHNASEIMDRLLPPPLGRDVEHRDIGGVQKRG